MSKRVGIIGAGYGKQVLLPVFRRIKECEVVAIATSNDAKANLVASESGIPRGYGDWRAMLDAEALDIVALAVPAAVQAEILPELFRRKVAVLAEKPLASNRTQADQLRSLSPPALAVDFEFPEHAAFQDFEKRLRTATPDHWVELRVTWNVMTYANRAALNSWKVTPAQGGGVLALFGSHVFHHLDRWFGNIKIESAEIDKAPGDRRADSETGMKVRGTVGAGLPFQISIDSASREDACHRYELSNGKTSLVLENRSPDYMNGFHIRGEAVPPSKSNDGRIDAVEKIARRLVETMATGRPVQPGIEEAYRVEKALDECRRLAPKASHSAELEIIIPVYNEGENIVPVLAGIHRHVRTPYQISIVYDFDGDNTLPAVSEANREKFRVKFVKNEGARAHGAVLTGFRQSTAPYVLVFPADDITNGPMLDAMVEKARAGADIVCASRFIRGGCMQNCPWLKAILVRTAAFTLRHLARLPARDATNGFRLFSQRVLKSIPIESSQGFTYSLELLVKSHRRGYAIAEVPARWIERKAGRSRFQVLKWIPAYLRWYVYAFQTTYLSFGRPSRKAHAGLG